MAMEHCASAKYSKNRLGAVAGARPVGRSRTLWSTCVGFTHACVLCDSAINVGHAQTCIEVTRASIAALGIGCVAVFEVAASGIAATREHEEERGNREKFVHGFHHLELSQQTHRGGTKRHRNFASVVPAPDDHGQSS